MKRFLRIFALFALVAITTLSSSSCNAQRLSERLRKQVAVEAVEDISGSLDGGWIIKLRVRNDSSYNPTLSAGEGDIYIDGVRVAHASLLAPVTLHKRQTASVSIPLDISIYSPLKALSLLLRIKQRNFDGIDIAFSANVEMGGIKRTIGTERIAATTLLQSFGLNR